MWADFCLFCQHHKDGDIVRPLADGSAPDPPEGFTIVVKDNGLMVLRKKRYRDLKKVGIGGFLAKTRTPKTSTKKDAAGLTPGEEDKKKRPVWRPKKNKILVQYPEYIQDSFFGKEFMLRCPDRVDEEAALATADTKRIMRQDEGTSLCLNRDALAALEDMKAKEEAEKKEKEQELADARAAAEAAAADAADKFRLAKEELEALKSGVDASKGIKSSFSGIKEEDDVKMEDDDLMLPTDLFGDDLFSNLMSGGEIDIDDSALDEAEQVEPDASGAAGATGLASKANNELEVGLRDMLGPDFDAKDMEDIFKGMGGGAGGASDTAAAAAGVSNADDKSGQIKTEIKSEPGDGLPSAVNDTLNQLTSQGSANFGFPASTGATPTSIKEELIATSASITSGPLTAASSAPSSSTYVSGLPTNMEIKSEFPAAGSVSSQMQPAASAGIAQPPPPPGAHAIPNSLTAALNNPGQGMAGIRPGPNSTLQQQQPHGRQTMPAGLGLPAGAQNNIRSPALPPGAVMASQTAAGPAGMLSGGQNMIRASVGQNIPLGGAGVGAARPSVPLAGASGNTMQQHGTAGSAANMAAAQNMPVGPGLVSGGQNMPGAGMVRPGGGGGMAASVPGPTNMGQLGQQGNVQQQVRHEIINIIWAFG